MAKNSIIVFDQTTLIRFKKLKAIWIRTNFNINYVLVLKINITLNKI